MSSLRIKLAKAINYLASKNTLYVNLPTSDLKYKFEEINTKIELSLNQITWEWDPAICIKRKCHVILH